MKKTISTVLLGVILLASLLFTGCAPSYSQEELDAKVQSAVDSEKTLADETVQTLKALQENEINSLKETEKSLNSEIEKRNSKILELESKVLEVDQAEEEEEVVEETAFYLIENVDLTGNFSKTVDNDRLSTLYFTDIDYDGETYVVEETLTISSDVKPSLNVKDFGEDVTISIENEGGLVYTVEFEDRINITKDEALVVNFLGSELSIVETSDNEIEFRTSSKVTLSVGETKTNGEDTVELVGLEDDDENVALIKVNDELKSIKEEQTRTIGGVEVSIDNIFISSMNDYNSVELYIGEDITENVETGDEFEADDRYEWIIDADVDGLKSIGIQLIEELVEEDEVLALGDSIGLPGDYKVVTFSSVRELDVSDLEISVRTNKIRVDYDGKIEILDEKIDNSEFVIIEDNGSYVVEYEYKGKDKTAELSEYAVVIFAEEKEISIECNSSDITVGDYSFSYSFVTKEITSGPSEIDEDEGQRMDNGDVLYASDVNDAEEETTSVTVGFANNEDKEVILRVE